MASSSEAAATRSRRLHTVKNVDQNIRAARERALARQKRLENLAKPLHSVSEQLARLDRERESVENVGQRRIETLQSGLEKKIEKLKADTATKIEQAKKDAATKLAELQDSQRGSEDALLLEYAQAIVQFSFGGSNADLATVLGCSQKEAKELIASSTADLKNAGISVTPPKESSAAADTAPDAETTTTDKSATPDNDTATDVEDSDSPALTAV
ncbi:MAG: hypothetical protein WAW17_13130 [Rhodococcus sp. (in: high G+C Gram-positive bacteria)]|uniref:hypothetical protein n=1 Tax=Rhodococcus sp. TaxID=1831 RepID=UPI003BB0EB79